MRGILKKKMRYARIVLISVFIYFLIINHAFAGISVEPVVAEIVVSKIAGNTKTLKVTNTGQNPVKVRVELDKTHKTDNDINTWFAIEPREIVLQPNEKKDFSYSIIPPPEASGELRCMIFFVADELEKKKATFGVRFGVPVYAVIEETVKLDAEIENCDLKYNYDKRELSGTIYIKNKGNVHIRPFINLEILDKAGKMINSFEIPFGQPAQAGQLRPFMFNKKMELSPSIYKLRATVDYGKMCTIKDKIIVKETELEVKEKIEHELH